MHLSHLSLNEFRNYKHLDLSLGRGLYLFYGENAQGKTNLLEAVGMLATGSSFDASSDREVVDWYAPDHIARLTASIQRREDDLQVEMVIFDPTPPYVETHTQAASRPVELPSTTQRKRIKINSIPRKVIDLIGQMKVVLFAPTDLHLVAGSPEQRRRFLDRALCQLQPPYCQALVQYRKIVTQRSALLNRIRDNHEDPRMLDYRDKLLTALPNEIIFARHHMPTCLIEQNFTLYETLSGAFDHCRSAS